AAAWRAERDGVPRPRLRVPHAESAGPPLAPLLSLTGPIQSARESWLDDAAATRQLQACRGKGAHARCCWFEPCYHLPPGPMSTASLFSVPADSPTISFELYPPRTPKGERELPGTVAALAAVDPDFFSVTYGASGRTRESSGALLEHILTRTDVPAIAHLTCVGASEEDLDGVVRRLLDIGVRDVLALRGDPPEGEPDWRPHPQGYTPASELVQLLRRVEAQRFGTPDGDGPRPLSIAVAAYPGGTFDADGVPVVDPTTVQAL